MLVTTPDLGFEGRITAGVGGAGRAEAYEGWHSRIKEQHVHSGMKQLGVSSSSNQELFGAYDEKGWGREAELRRWDVAVRTGGALLQ